MKRQKTIPHECLSQSKSELEVKGFLDLDVDPTLDLFEAIQRLKKEKML